MELGLGKMRAKKQELKIQMLLWAKQKLPLYNLYIRSKAKWKRGTTTNSIRDGIARQEAARVSPEAGVTTHSDTDCD